MQINTAMKQQSFRDEKADRPPPGSARPNTGRTDHRGGSKQERRGHLILRGRDAQIEEGERVAGARTGCLCVCRSEDGLETGQSGLDLEMAEVEREDARLGRRRQAVAAGLGDAEAL